MSIIQCFLFSLSDTLSLASMHQLSQNFAIVRCRYKIRIENILLILLNVSLKETKRQKHRILALSGLTEFSEVPIFIQNARCNSKIRSDIEKLIMVGYIDSDTGSTSLKFVVVEVQSLKYKNVCTC